MLNGRATPSGRAAEGDHKDAARPEVVVLPNNDCLKFDEVDLIVVPFLGDLRALLSVERW